MKFRFLFIGLVMGAMVAFPSWTHAYCGNGALEATQGEQCDDGNFVDRDGCNSYCALEDIDPPSITSVSIAEGASDIPTNTAIITINFSEPVDPASVISNNISVRHADRSLAATFTISQDQTEITLHLQEELVSNGSHAIRINNIRDPLGNTMKEVFIRTFTAATYIDRTAPYVVAKPPAGEYNFSQNVSLVAYLSEAETGLDDRDESVTVYYTLDGSYPTTASPVYPDSLIIEKHATLQFFGIDGSGNRSRVFTQVYRFACAARPNAERVSPYPICSIQECKRGFNLISGTCATQELNAGSTVADAYKDNAFTAPLLPSDVPVTVSTKPAIYISPYHKGNIYRPIIFINVTRGSKVFFEKDTFITDSTGKAFAGYLVTPVNRYNKEFPTNFGYSFKSIVEFS
ncbi:MAG: chitobiase/beta-hexosaminidase C-terminal domain-containing protein, partial [Candidatus Peregrinibacteria bacterium]